MHFNKCPRLAFTLRKQNTSGLAFKAPLSPPCHLTATLTGSEITPRCAITVVCLLARKSLRNAGSNDSICISPRTESSEYLAHPNFQLPWAAPGWAQRGSRSGPGLMVRSVSGAVGCRGGLGRVLSVGATQRPNRLRPTRVPLGRVRPAYLPLRWCTSTWMDGVSGTQGSACFRSPTAWSIAPSPLPGAAGTRPDRGRRLTPGATTTSTSTSSTAAERTVCPARTSNLPRAARPPLTRKHSGLRAGGASSGLGSTSGVAPRPPGVRRALSQGRGGGGHALAVLAAALRPAPLPRRRHGQEAQEAQDRVALLVRG